MTDLAIARVVKAHGVRGEIAVAPLVTESTTLDLLDDLRLSRDGQVTLLVVQARRRTPRGYLIKLAGIDDRDAASRLVGSTVIVPRAALPSPPPGELYLVDLIGADVVGPDGPVGRVVDVVRHPSVESVIIELTDGRRAEQPLVPDFVSALEPGRVELTSLEGLL